MIPVENWGLFALLALMATLSPGPAIFLVITHSLTYGVRQSIATIAGNVSGLFIMSSLALFGVGAVLAYSATVFMVLKYLGAAYLIFMGLKLWRTGFTTDKLQTAKTAKAGQWGALYRRGLLVALSNPKAIAFSSALFPQFIDVQRAVLPQFGVLVLTFMSLSFACLLGYAVFFRHWHNRLHATTFFEVVSKIFSGLLIGAGLLLASGTQAK